MKSYQIQEVFNLIQGLLTGRKTTPERFRSMTKIFICENCSGSGYFSKSKSDPYGEDCEVCKGTGKIKLQFDVKQVELKEK